VRACNPAVPGGPDYAGPQSSSFALAEKVAKPRAKRLVEAGEYIHRARSVKITPPLFPLLQGDGDRPTDLGLGNAAPLKAAQSKTPGR